MKATPAEIEKYLAAITETPGRIALAVDGFDEARLRAKVDAKSWSASDVLAHLRSCSDVWGDIIHAMIEQENPALPNIHPRQWIKRTNYPLLPFGVSFDAFTAQRNAMLLTLKDLALTDWSRSATIGGREHTIFTQVRRMALHEQVHCRQIEQLLQGRAGGE